ncbi:hypothetical protein [Desulfofalx alkaliphila]|uniref:hypothetical protein n=1 Tax=Desulfofalx alkaliphila TaxID=105483 RepID=UPI0004E26103|nr:hypothetical protein [Desulfofalx alkaliphila]
MLKLKCDKGCKEEFTLIEPGTDIVYDDILKTYFCCPHCGQEYVSHYTNTGIRELQDTVRVLQEGPKRNKRKTKRMIQDLQARIKVGMDRLREEI